LGSVFGINPALVRKFFIYLSFVTLGSPLLIYFPLAYFLENIDKLKWRKKRKTVWDFK
jgi:phage shock protein PspC (stress-responsive transcriptional regulator)